MPTTIGCLSRVYVGEIPYLKYFIEHGIKIGIDTFYFVFPSDAHMGALSDIIKQYPDHCQIIVEDQGRNVNHALRIDIQSVKTDYLVSIDIDEFIYVPGDVRLGDYLAEKDISAARLKWIMSPRDFDEHTGPIEGFKGHTGKNLARTSLITGIKNPHSFDSTEEMPFSKDKGVKLVHYWGRSFEDIVIKCIYQNLPNRKRSSLEEMTDLVKQGKIPERLRVLASLASHENNRVLHNHMNHQLRDRALEQDLLKIASKTLLDDVEGLYRQFKAGLDYDTQVGAYPKLGNIYALGALLSE
ncbi:hypothetical protein [Rhizobium sp.]